MSSISIGSGIARRGIMFILASPSGAGKSTLSRLLLQNEPDIHLSVSVTTRPRRPSEVEGVHYLFKTRAQFDSMVAAGDFIEWAEVHGHHYGTPKLAVNEMLEKGRDVLFDIDWQGTLQIYEHARDDVVSVFLLPPSVPELKARLARRAEDPADVVEKRLQNAKTEIAAWKHFDYVLVNDDLNQSYAALHSILMAERLRRHRQSNLGPFVEKLRGAL